MEHVFPQIKIVFYVGIGVIALGVLILVGIIPTKQKTPAARFIGSLVCIIVGIFLFTIDEPGSIAIENNKLILKFRFYGTKTISEIDIQDIKIVDLRRDVQYVPIRKRSGASYKDVRTGWFILNNREKAFVALEGKLALYIKSRDGVNYLVGIKDFDHFLEVFRQQVYPSLQ